MQSDNFRRKRPAGITALSIFFCAGAGISFVSGVSLLAPGGFLEPMWRLNPRARENFAALGPWAVVLLVSVSLACAAAGVGLWKGKPWGRLVAIGLLLVNLIGDAANAIVGIEPRAAIGIPIAAALVAYLMTKRVRRFFAGKLH